VLLVDDDEYNIVVLKSLLPSPPLAVRTAVNGRAALQLVQEARPDVIFLDLEMPIMGGLEARAPHPRTAAGTRRATEPDRGLLGARRRRHGAGNAGSGVRPLPGQAGVARRSVRRAARRRPGGSAAARADERVWVEPGLLALMPEFLSSRRKLADDLAAAAAQGEREAIRTTRTSWRAACRCTGSARPATRAARWSRPPAARTSPCCARRPTTSCACLRRPNRKCAPPGARMRIGRAVYRPA
jgi:hypothetical protein